MQICLFSKVPRSPLGPRQPPNEWVPGAFSPEVKCPVCESDHSPQPSTEVKKFWNYISTPLHTFTFSCVHYQVKWPQKINKCALKGFHCITLFLHSYAKIDGHLISRGIKVPCPLSSPQIIASHPSEQTFKRQYWSLSHANKLQDLWENMICILDSIWTILSERYFKTSMNDPKVIDNQGTIYTGSTTSML
jgi:hypothetical protein